MNKMRQRRRSYSSTTGADYVKCPFFRGHEKNCILCESCIAANDVHKFKTAAEKDWHKETFCEKEYKKCMHYITVMHWDWPEDE